MEAGPDCLDSVHEQLAALWSEAPEVEARARMRFATAVAEIVGNVVEHGRTPAGSAPHMLLELRTGDAGLEAHLEDDGVALPEEPGAPVDEMSESGRGLELARAAADAVVYERVDGRNRWDISVACR